MSQGAQTRAVLSKYSPDRMIERGIRFADDPPRSLRYESRTSDGHYQSLMQQPTRDGIALQRALMKERSVSARVDRIIGRFCVAILCAAIGALIVSRWGM